MFDWIADPQAWMALATLTALEIVLGIDNIIFLAILVQIALLDLVFSLDSVVTAVGTADHLPVMIIAVVIAILFMMAFAGSVGEFITRHPSLKMLALAFLVLIGTVLVADGLEFHIPKGYIYFAMAFSFAVELLNQRVRARRARRRGSS